MKEENNLTKIEAVEQMRGKRSIGRSAENNGERRMKYYLLGRTGKKIDCVYEAAVSICT